MTVSENFVNLVPSLLDNGCGSTDSAKIRRIFEISPADFESIKYRKPRISIYETIELLYCTVFGTTLLYAIPKLPYLESLAVTERLLASQVQRPLPEIDWVPL